MCALFNPQDYLDEFRSFCAGVAETGRNPLNTEMFFLWSIIRTYRPELLIESGTFRGYSAVFICEALRRNANGAEFVTFGYNLENCLPYARQRLAEYPFARVIEQDSRTGIRQFDGEMRAAAFFIDGPKGRNMPALFGGILRTFKQIHFLAVHDCQPEIYQRQPRLSGGLFWLAVPDPLLRQPVRAGLPGAGPSIGEQRRLAAFSHQWGSPEVLWDGNGLCAGGQADTGPQDERWFSAGAALAEVPFLVGAQKPD